MIHPDLVAHLQAYPGATIVTAGLRLARAVRNHVALAELDAGAVTWQPPVVMPWSAWIGSLWEAALFASDADDMPALLGASQLRSVWHEIVTGQLTDDARELVNVDGLVAASIDTERRLAEWRIDDGEPDRHVMTEDMRFFSVCLQRYRALLARRRWIARHDVPRYLESHGLIGRLGAPTRIALAGFDRLTPDQRAFVDALTATGTSVARVDESPPARGRGGVDVMSLPTHDDELFAAGEWARLHLEARPGDRLAIVVPGLAGEARRARRLVAETLFPGWQYRPALTAEEARRLPEVSFGEPLVAYPAVATAVDLLDCALRPPDFRTISRLLRSPLLGAANRSRGPDQELQMRGMPDRRWSLDDLARWLEARGGEPAWLTAARGFPGAGGLRRPEQWAEAIDAMLATAEWLAVAAEGSASFQLRNAWRSALNELGALGDTIGACTARRAVLELRQILTATIYQPEGRDAAVTVLGPLEASGLTFDAIRVVGLDAGSWPPAGRPLPLLPLALQRDHGMPDATAADTLQYAQRVLKRLCEAAPEVVLSWPRAAGEEMLTASPLLATYGGPGHGLDTNTRYAANAYAGVLVLQREPDPVAALASRFRAPGGHALLDRQRTNPFAALVLGRLRCRALEEPAGGPDGRVRGILIHNALSHVYGAEPDSESLRALSPARLAALVTDAVARAARPYYIAADSRLRQLLDAERARACELIHTFVREDLSRGPFRVTGNEQQRDLALGRLDLRMRLDRVDDVEGRVWIVDYKTGRRIGGFNADRLPDVQGQLAMYALTETDPSRLDALLLAAVNRDRSADFVGVATREGTAARLGKRVRYVDDFEPLLADWRRQYERLAQDFVRGDIRINANVPVAEQRDIAVLSRLFVELSEVSA